MEIENGKRKDGNRKKLENLVEKLNKAKIKIDLNIKITRNHCKIIGGGTIPGMLVGLSNYIKSTREQMNKKGIEKEAAEFLLENFFKAGMEG